MQPTIISFYTLDENGKPITEHLSEHVGCMIKLFSRGGKVGCYGYRVYGEYRSIKRSQGYNLPLDYHGLITASMIFHDIGKALYQKRVAEAIRLRRRYASYAGHEVFSAALVHDAVKHLSATEPEKYSVEALAPTTYSILYHHHSLMGGSGAASNRIESLRNTLKHIDDPREMLDVAEHELSDLLMGNSLAKKLLDNAMEVITKTVAKLRENPYRSVLDIESGLKRIVISGKHEYMLLKKTMNLTLATLIALDYEAAHKIRGGRRTIFGQMCSKWFHYYIL